MSWHIILSFPFLLFLFTLCSQCDTLVSWQYVVDVRFYGIFDA
uniref:Uncharacterized protein n=1 Tax=Rhizophora mucronata TaxID=61149 RepID=A0A2P2J1X2_RHIMU